MFFELVSGNPSPNYLVLGLLDLNKISQFVQLARNSYWWASSILFFALFWWSP